MEITKDVVYKLTLSEMELRAILGALENVEEDCKYIRGNLCEEIKDDLIDKIRSIVKTDLMTLWEE